MTTSSRIAAYIEHVSQLEQAKGPGEEALRLAVGGEFEAVGKLEYYLLRFLGLRGGQLLIDVGCGSGRLACKLAPHKDIAYVGTDVVPQLLEAARAIAGRDDWKFVLVEDITIPCADDTADIVTFFSVLTHLTHEESFRYIREAARCLKKGGFVVASFLEFRDPWHWDIFAGSVATERSRHWNQFTDRDAIAAWASHSGLSVESFFGGEEARIPIPEDILWENGTCMKSFANFGQALAVLRKT
ncbi:MAG: class I SAM-dependent methyltransferase [Chthoniobacterales bacterium]|nr:class I SAM-dependent methyltransferase [Chthoniobacterales bacterium]